MQNRSPDFLRFIGSNHPRTGVIHLGPQLSPFLLNKSWIRAAPFANRKRAKRSLEKQKNSFPLARQTLSNCWSVCKSKTLKLQSDCMPRQPLCTQFPQSIFLCWTPGGRRWKPSRTPRTGLCQAQSPTPESVKTLPISTAKNPGKHLSVPS